jgi:hypothetical protein
LAPLAMAETAPGPGEMLMSIEAMRKETQVDKAMAKADIYRRNGGNVHLN